MKKAFTLFLATYLFIGSLFPGNSFFEFSEVPALIKHFQYHRLIETPGIGFIDFMVMHYSNADHEKSDPANHAKLPVHHGFTTVVFDQFISSRLVLKTLPHKFNNSIQLFSFEQFIVSSAYTEAIFHPPKV